MEKYYTPELEEFHVGFEFEYNKGGDNWVKHTSGNHDFRDGIIDVGVGETDDALYNPFHMGISEREFRVKHLDREDIESLGWVSGESYGMSCYLRTDENGVAIIDGYQLDFHSWELVEIYQESTSDLKFSGTIKNKSELKKLLKQLGI